ncbi:hypothetical protein N2152v2_011212 [Parachlorella kessleri]
MGLPMATKLQSFLRGSDCPPGIDKTLLVYNRSPGKAKALTDNPDLASEAVDSPADLAGCSIVFVMLAQDSAVEQVFRSYLEGRAALGSAAPAGAAFVDCSTVLPSTTTRLAGLAASQEVAYCAGPVFGRPDAAAAGMLKGVVAGGTAELRGRIQQLAAGYAGRGVWDLGDDPGPGHAMKLMGNMFIIGQMELAAHCLALGSKSGVPQQAVLEFMDFCVKGPIPGGYANRMAAGDFNAETGFKVELALKDAGHMRQLARDVACPLPIVDVAYNHLLTAKAKFGGDLDWGALALSVRDAAGLEPNIKQKHS